MTIVALAHVQLHCRDNTIDATFCPTDDHMPIMLYMWIVSLPLFLLNMLKVSRDGDGAVVRLSRQAYVLCSYMLPGRRLARYCFRRLARLGHRCA